MAKAIPRAATDQGDMVALLSIPAFQRFLLRVVINSGMLAEANGSEDRHLRIAEGRRSLGFDILRWADEALSVSHPSALPVYTLGMILRNEVQPPEGNHVDETQDDEDEPDVRR